MGPSFETGDTHQPTFSLGNQGSRLRERRRDFARAQEGRRGRPIPAVLGCRNSWKGRNSRAVSGAGSPRGSSI